MAGKKKPGIPVKSINIKLRMINDLIDVTGSAKDSWNPAEISDDMKAIAYIRDLADTWNPAQLNEALKYLGFATIDSWNPAIIEETKNKLVKYFLPTDASGNPIELDLNGALPYDVTSLTIDLLPIQDLHGYDSPWVGGAGVNQLPPPTDGTSSNNGVTISVVGGKYSLSGSATSGSANLSFNLKTPYTIKSGDYLHILNTSAKDLISITLKKQDNTAIVSPLLTPINRKLDLSYVVGETVYSISFYVANGNTTDFSVSPMILSTSSDTNWSPWENICPISGRNSVTLTVNTEDTEITLPQTVYGGNVNVLDGGTSSTYGYISSYDGEELPGAWISDRDAYAAGTSPTTGAEVAYILATPDELTTSAEEVTLLNGENTLSTDGDNINITYKAILNS